MISTGTNSISLSAAWRSCHLRCTDSFVIPRYQRTNAGHHSKPHLDRQTFCNTANLYKNGRGRDSIKNARRQRVRILGFSRVRKVVQTQQQDGMQARTSQNNIKNHEEVDAGKNPSRNPRSQKEFLEALSRVNIDKRWKPRHIPKYVGSLHGHSSGLNDGQVDGDDQSVDNENDASGLETDKDNTSGASFASDADEIENTFNPFTNRGKADLAAMIADLEAMTSHSTTKPRTLMERAQEAFAAGQGSINFPIHSMSSPIERRVDALHERTQPKRRVSSEDYDVQLSKNPWAQMLASPVRLDSATKVRMPKSLMTSWGVVREPRSSLDYLMPMEASDLDNLKLRLTPRDHQSSPLPPAKPIDGERVFIQPNSLLMQAMSDELLKKSTNPQIKPKMASSMLVNSLIPFRWRDVLSRAEAYRRTQTTIDEESGKESLDMTWKKDIPNFRSLQWQADIDTRLNLILCERLMLAFDGLANNNDTARGVRGKKVFAMDVPENGIFSLEAQAIVHESARQNRRGHRTTTEVVDESRVPRWHPGSIFLHVGSPQHYARIIQKWYDQNHEANLGVSSSEYLPPLPDNPLVPPMITLRASHEQTFPLAVRLPIFNLATLLGPAYLSRVQQSISQYGTLNQTFWTNIDAERRSFLDHKFEEKNSRTLLTTATKDQEPTNNKPSDENDTDDNDPEMVAFLAEQSRLRLHEASANADPPASDKEYIILVKSTAVKSKEFVDEIWQLWRYIGGRDGLWFGEGAGNEQETTASDQQ